MAGQAAARGAIFGSVMCACGLYCFATVRERYDPDTESTEKLPWLKGMKIVFSNKAFVCIVLVYLFGLTATVTVQTNLMLYLKYILNSEEQFACCQTLPNVIECQHRFRRQAR